jgi:hypothetical protein
LFKTLMFERMLGISIKMKIILYANKKSFNNKISNRRKTIQIHEM